MLFWRPLLDAPRHVTSYALKYKLMDALPKVNVEAHRTFCTSMCDVCIRARSDIGSPLTAHVWFLMQIK